MIGVFSGIRSKRPFQTPDKTLLTVTLCMLDKLHIICTKYQDYYNNIASQTVTDVLGSK